MGKILIILLSIVYIIVGQPDWLLGDCDVTYKALGYSFCHANVFHLACNLIAINSVFGDKHKDNVRCLCLGMLVAVLAYPFAIRPMAGFSNVIYAAIGMRTPSFKSKWWIHPQVLTFLAITLAMVVIPQISATTHMVSFAMGVGIAHILRIK